MQRELLLLWYENRHCSVRAKTWEFSSALCYWFMPYLFCIRITAASAHMKTVYYDLQGILNWQWVSLKKLHPCHSVWTMWVMFLSFTGRKSIFRIFPAELRAPEYGQVDFGTLPLKLQDKGRMKAGCYVRRAANGNCTTGSTLRLSGLGHSSVWCAATYS